MSAAEPGTGKNLNDGDELGQNLLVSLRRGPSNHHEAAMIILPWILESVHETVQDYG
jgi:hypothetical protein